MIENIIIAIISSIAGGLFVLLVSRVIEKNDRIKEKEKGFTPTNTNASTVLTNEIINLLSPEKNYLKVQEIFGFPDKTYSDYSIFELDSDNLENEVSYTSDLYQLKNALLKITTIDKQSIYAITVFGFNDSLHIPDMFYPCDECSDEFTKAKICSEIINNMIKSTSIRTMKEMSFSIQNYIGPPFYKRITFFCDDMIENEGSPDILIGKEITGFCLSNSEPAFYIYAYEHL